jgi:hypothetical protein
LEFAPAASFRVTPGGRRGRFRHYRGVPAWIKSALLVLVAAVVLLLPGALDWVINGRADYGIVGAGGLLALGVVLVRWHRRERGRVPGGGAPK